MAAIPRRESLSGLRVRLSMFAEHAYLTREALASDQKPTPFFTSSAVFEENLLPHGTSVLHVKEDVNGQKRQRLSSLGSSFKN